MNDDQAGAVALAVMTLAVVVRDEGPAAVSLAAAEVLAAAAGDPVAALVIAAALVPVEAPPDAWWRDPNPRLTFPVDDFDDPEHPAHGSHNGYVRHRNRKQQPCGACVAGDRRYHAARYQRRKTERSTAA